MNGKPATRSRNWTIGTAVVSIAILLAAWFLGAMPLWTSASEATSTAVDQEASNDMTQIQVDKLRAQFAKIDDYKAQLAGLRIQVPTTLEHAEFQRQLAAIAKKNDVTVSRIEFSSSTEVDLSVDAAAALAAPLGSEAQPSASPSPTAAADSPSDGTTTTDESGASTTSTGGGRKFKDFYVIPVKIELQGSYASVLATLEALQTSKQRLFLVTGLSGSGIEAGSGTSTGAKKGDLALSIDGTLSVLLDSESNATAPADEKIEAPVLPQADPGDNPLTSAK